MAPNTGNVPKTEPHPFLLSVEDVAKQLGTNVETGLTARKVADLQRECPPNELVGGGGIAWYKILTKQLSNAMILVSLCLSWNPYDFGLTQEQVLVFAMALSFGVDDPIEGGVLAAVIVLNVSIGFFQEFKAEKKMDSLRALSSPSAAVLRDGKVDVIPRFVKPPSIKRMLAD
jgi:Na+-exporting ATPase